ncbi:glycosyl transferase family 1 [Geomonas limicola]|uniref:Glycosyl transferase family 1 n=1 Tax=Geomonas limicola TaxID=2740186 RepID=A0A6V8N8W6_9BACT|nr:glycosyltransferase family 4 protein [Geomonas limicola]GFO69008.1 glycosyl transferase family 1 [Geomonas limicola]
MSAAAHTVLYFVNQLEFFLSHRLPLARAAQNAGYRVHVAGPRSPAVARLEAEGFVFHEIPMTRSGVHPVQELATFWRIYRLLGRLQPAILHNVALKAVFYGSLGARLARTHAVVNALTGLGFVFIARHGRARLLRTLIMAGLRLAFRQRRHRLIMQNHDDPRLFIDAKVVPPEEVVVIRGSGVDLAEFCPAPEPPGEIRAVLVSRMLWDKGVGDFVEAARELKRRSVPVQCLLIGDHDPGNRASVPVDQLTQWHREGVVQWLGHSSEIADVFAQAHIVCLPSYREGLPKVLIEAAACGRAIVTSDVPGCREIVQHGLTGLVVPVRDGRALAEAIERLAREDELRRSMAHRGRALAEQEFSVEKVLAETLAVYRGLL